MSRMRLPTILLLAAVAAQGCGAPQDPGQPPIGSISVKPKADDDGPLAGGRPVKGPGPKGRPAKP